MHEQVLTLTAPEDRPLLLWFEPWASGLGFPPGTVVELHARSRLAGQLGVSASEERTAIYGWGGSTLSVRVDGEEMRAFDYPVPDSLTPEMVTLLFGDPPVPDPEDIERARQWPTTE